jgi:hypothetical protein
MHDLSRDKSGSSGCLWSREFIWGSVSARPFLQGFDTLPFFRNRIFVQAVLLPSYSSNASSEAPLLHGRYPFPWLCIPLGRWGRDVSSPPCRVSQALKRRGSSTDLFLRAVPNHPGRLDGCACSLLPRRCQASSSLADWPPSIASRGRIGFDHYGSQVCFPGFRQTDCSASLRFRYMHERAIYMVNSFQFTRSARLSLVFPRTPRNRQSRRALFCG